MPARIREVHRPADWRSARQLLSRAGVRTVPLFVSPRPKAVFEYDAEAVLDLSQLNLNYIRSEAGTIHLGAATPLSAIVESRDLAGPTRDLLAEALSYAAHPGLRNVATAGGVLTPDGDACEFLLSLLALDATLILQSDKSRETRLTEFLAGSKLAPDELIAEVRFTELPAGAGAAMARVARTPKDEAIVASVAVVASDFARVAVAGASRYPMLKSHSGPISNLQSQQLADAIRAEAAPIGDYRGSEQYRREMAGVLAKRALEEAMRKAA